MPFPGTSLWWKNIYRLFCSSITPIMAENKKTENKLGTCVLPISRIRTIMKSSPEVSNINPEALFLIAKSTELFIEDLSRQTLENGKGGVEYGTLADMVNTDDTLAFLQDIVPKKIKYADYLAIKKRSKSEGDEEEA